MSKPIDELVNFLGGCERSMRALEHADLTLDALVPSDDDIEDIESNELEEILKEFQGLEKLQHDKR